MFYESHNVNSTLDLILPKLSAPPRYMSCHLHENGTQVIKESKSAKHISFLSLPLGSLLSAPSNYLLLAVLSVKPILKSMIFTKSDTRLTWTCWFKMIRSCFNFLLPTNYHMFWNRCAAVQSLRDECWLQNNILQSLHLVWTRVLKC